MLTHGWGKMFGGLEGFTQAVAGMGIPVPQVSAFLAAFAESFGAILLAIGLLTRPAAFLIVGHHGRRGLRRAQAARHSRRKKPPGSTSSPPCSSCSRAPASGRSTR